MAFSIFGQVVKPIKESPQQEGKGWSISYYALTNVDCDHSVNEAIPWQLAQLRFPRAEVTEKVWFERLIWQAGRDVIGISPVTDAKNFPSKVKSRNFRRETKWSSLQRMHVEYHSN